MTLPSDRLVRVRSPLLRTFNDWTDSETRNILRRRRAAAAVIIALVVAFVLLTRAGVLPLPALDLLYVLHDYAALPFWGYTWTLFAPYSVTWWSLAAIAVLIWIATYLTRRSAVRRFHARLCRLVVVHLVAQSGRSSRHVARLTAWIDWLGAWGLRAELLKDVARLEQARALDAIVASGSMLDEAVAWRLVRLTDLLARLTGHAGALTAERWRSLAIWHQALMWLDCRAGTAPRSPAVAKLFAALATTGYFLLDRLAEVNDEEGDTVSSVLRTDLRWLVEYADGKSPANAPFIRSVLERLDDLWALAERGSDDGAPPLTAKAGYATLCAQGVLVSSVGLHAASLTADAHLAAAHVQAFETLSFVAHLRAAGRDGTRLAQALTADAPARDHYSLAADIAERSRTRRASAPSLGRAVLDEATRHERTRIEGLQAAAWLDCNHAASRRSAKREGGRAEREGGHGRAEHGSGRDHYSRLLHRIRYRPLPLRMRVDPVLLSGLAAASIVYCIAIGVLVLLFAPSDTASWSARALPDRRLLDNVRRGLDTAPFLDAIYHEPTHELVISQRGGALHSYDPDTGLWSTARPFSANDLAQPDIRLLAPSTDGNSGTLWGVTAGGGLVRRQRGRWQVVVGDTRFVGRGGTPIQQTDLSAIAASSDGKWLLAAAGAEGVGIQDLERRRWLSRDEVTTADVPLAVTHAVWWRDRFYVGGPDGVAELAVNSAPLAFQRVSGLEGMVVSLEPSTEHGLFVHQTVPCENGPPGCMRLSRLTDPSAAPAVLIDERNRYTDLNFDRLFYAVQWQNHLLLAGASGIFGYDAQLRSWKRHAAETVSAIGQCASSSCFYYGYGGRSAGVALFTPKTITGDPVSRWALAGEQPIRIGADTPGTAAVLTAAGRAYALGPGSISTLVNPGTSSPLPLDRYRDAVTFGDKVLFYGSPGALLHDVVRRSYSTLVGVPAWLRSRSSIIATSGTLIFGLEPRGTTFDAHVAPLQQVELGTIFFNTSRPIPIDGPIRAVDASTPDVLRVVDGNGRVQSIAASGVTPLTGGRSTAMGSTRLLDVAGTPDVLAASTLDGVRLYSMRTRSWSNPMSAPIGERPLDIAQRDSAWLARTEANRLITVGGPQPSILIGGGSDLPRRQPTDVLQAGSEIYLSWAGTIHRYDARSRQITGSWQFDANEPVKLAGVAGSEPLSLAAGVARAGSREIARNVHSIFTSGSNVWLTREDRGRRYLEARPLASIATGVSTTACLFRAPNAGADVLLDARSLSNGLVAVTTDNGLKLYSRNRHSWYAVSGLSPGGGRGTLAKLGSTLIVWDGGDSRGTLQVVRTPFTLPDSCSTASGYVQGAPEVVAARALAVDERANAAYVVKEDGGIDRVSEAATTPIVGKESLGPPEADVVRTWHFPDIARSVLWVATRRSLWQYDLDNHNWFEIELKYPVGVRRATPATPRLGDVSIDLEAGSGGIAVFVTAASQTFRGTVAMQPGHDAAIALAPSSVRNPAGAPRVESPEFRIGAVTFFRTVSEGVLARLRTGDGRSTLAYRNRAFVWDRGRRGIAVGPEGPLVLSDAGIHPIESPASFASVDPGPPGGPSPADRLTSGPDFVPRMLRANRWYRRVGVGVWEPAPPPSGDAVVANESGLVWRRINGSIVVESATGQVSSVSTAQGVELSTDRLVDAAAYGTAIALLTPGAAEFAELESTPGAPTSLIAGPLFRAPQAETLDSATIGGQEVLWLTRSGAPSIWNRERRAFEVAVAGANPLERRTLAEIGPLRLTRVGGSIEGALQVADLQGQLSWLPIDLSTGRFPFDVVRSIAAVGNALYVGTDAGLQLYGGHSFALEQAQSIVLPSGNGTAPTRVDSVGESCDAPGTAVACGPRGCARQSGAAFVNAPGDALSCRLRARSPFWQWQVDASGLSGRYSATPAPATRASVPLATFADGQFAHDDISQVVALGGSTFTVWHSRNVSVHTRGLTLIDVRNHAFVHPVRLVNVPAPVPLLRARDRDLPSGLYAIEGPRTWRYGSEGWTIVTGGAEMSAIADYDANPPLLQRKRLRLVRHSPGTAPVFEMRMPDRGWTPLAWDASAGRFALDVWQDLAVHRRTLWAATPAGLVSRDGNWLLDPDAFRVVEMPPHEAGRAVTDLRIDGSVAVLRYDGERAYRMPLDGSAAVRLESDPFAERTFDVDSRYWTWRITGRTGASTGRLTGTWKGEPIAVVNGRFDFDAINSVALFQRLLHVATNTRGWFTLPADATALDRLSRPQPTSVPSLGVTNLYTNGDPDEPELCLQGADGQFTRVSPTGSHRRTQGCPVLAARTGFWRYTRDGSALRVLPAASAARAGERRLVDGRFTDDVITGVPVSGTKDGQSITLVPTAAGVMWWNASNHVTDMHAPPFQGKPDAPRLLQWTAGGSPAYVADGTLYSLEHDDTPRDSWTVRLPPTAVFERLATGPGPLLSIDWSDNGRRHHTVVDPRNSSVSHDDIPIDARKIPAYFQRAMTERSNDGLIRLRLRDHVVSAYGTAEGWPIVEADDSFQLLAGVSRGTRAFLVGPRHLIELNMERIARAVYSGQSPPRSSTGAEKEK